MKKINTLLAILLLSFPCWAGHIAGGEMYYKYLGPGLSPNTSKYEITLRLFRECNPVGTAAELPPDVVIGIFHNTVPATLIGTTDVNLTTKDVISLQRTLSCIINPPEVCYQIATYTFTQELTDDSLGYTFAYQTCCRSNSILNVKTFPIPGGQGPGEGATYMCEIPGFNVVPQGSHNSSAVFNVKDTVLICKSKNIDLDFSATDPDNDSLSYAFCAAYNRGNAINSSNVTPSKPPYVDVTYNTGYSGSLPLGGSIQINPVTGNITGMAPQVGGYVINVCVTEFRKGVAISVHRKDFMVDVGDCDFAAAELHPSYITCDGFTLGFKNEAVSQPDIHSYYWEFGDSSDQNTSSDATPAHTYADTGTYNIKLVINRGEQCSDSATARALVYPGFFPDFKINGSCILNPYQFTDLTATNYGVVNTWHWNFGDQSTTADTSLLQNPSYKYNSTDTIDVQLTVTNSKGCIDTITKSLGLSDTPSIALPFRDTLICSIDTLQLHASSGTGSGTFRWTPYYNISDTTNPNPFVSPKDTTIYTVTVNENGCVNTDYVTVNVIPKVLLNAGPDTTICQTDAVMLQPVTNALYFKWSPATSLDTSTKKNPLAVPLSDIQYQVVGSVGKCSALDVLNIKVVPYPLADAGNGASICYGKTTELHASMQASSFTWSPANSLLNANTLTPIAGPQSTTVYQFIVTDTLGCPKPVTDTVVVNVIPPVPAFAGNDTVIVANQPLQLNASGGDFYTWSPTTGMNDPNISNPVVLLGPQYDSIIYMVKVSTSEGCSAYDEMKVVVFKTLPDIFVPSAFTPNKDGVNDVLHAKAVGIKQFNYFKIFNRWGLMVFSTTQQDKGWDGTYAGNNQSSGTYVFIAQAVDYTGRLLTKKGTVVLIR